MGGAPAGDVVLALSALRLDDKPACPAVAVAQLAGGAPGFIPSRGVAPVVGCDHHLELAGLRDQAPHPLGPGVGRSADRAADDFLRLTQHCWVRAAEHERARFDGEGYRPSLDSFDVHVPSGDLADTRHAAWDIIERDDVSHATLLGP